MTQEELNYYNGTIIPYLQEIKISPTSQFGVDISDRMMANFRKRQAGHEYAIEDLPEVVVTPTKTTVGNITTHTTPKVDAEMDRETQEALSKGVTYDRNKAKIYEKEAQDAANKTALLLTPAAAPAAAPLIDMVLGEKVVAGLTKLGPKLYKGLQTITPGTKEFMTLWNAGTKGKILGSAITAGEAALEASALNSFIQNPSIETGATAALSTVPMWNGVGNMYRGLWNTASRAYKPVRDFRVGLDMQKLMLGDDLTRYANQAARYARRVANVPKRVWKWYKADTRGNQLAERLWNRAVELGNDLSTADQDARDAALVAQRISNLSRFSLNPWISGLPSPSNAVATRLNTQARLRSGITLLRGAEKPKPQALKYDWQELPIRNFYDNYKDLEILPDGSYSRVAFTGTSSPHGPISIDFSKLSQDDIIKLMASRTKGRTGLFREVEESYIREGLESGAIKLFKNENGEWIFQKGEITIPVNQLYNPEGFVSTSYAIPDYTDPSAPLLQGQIRFEGDNMAEPIKYVPELNLSTGATSSAPVLPELTGDPNYLAFFDQAYPERLARNIHYIEERLPGFVPFGSSVGVAEARFPHATGDIDGYMLESALQQWIKENPTIQGTWINPDTYTIHMFPEFGKAGDIDVNIIQADKKGMATGKRAVELARQFFPQQYKDYTLARLSDPKAQLNVQATALMEAVSNNKVAKAIADSFEINPMMQNKSKHAGRIFVYMSSADPDKVAEGINLIRKAYSAPSGFPIRSLADLSDPEVNRQILKMLNMPVSTTEVIHDPRKMKNILDYWYLQATVRGRGVDAQSKEVALSALFDEWNSAVNKGGNAKGAGRNAAVFGNTQYGNIYGFWQIPRHPAIDFDVPILDRIRAVQKLGGLPEYRFTPEEVSKIVDIAAQHGITLNPTQITNSASILDWLPRSSDASQKVLTRLWDEMGIGSLVRREPVGYGSYASMTGATSPDLPYTVISQNEGVNPIDLHNRVQFMGQKDQSPLIEQAQDQLSNLSLVTRQNRQGIPRHVELDTHIGISDEGWYRQHLKKLGKWDEYQKAKQAAVDEANAKAQKSKQISAQIDAIHERRKKNNRIRYRASDIKEWTGKTAFAGSIVGGAGALVNEGVQWLRRRPLSDKKKRTATEEVQEKAKHMSLEELQARKSELQKKKRTSPRTLELRIINDEIISRTMSNKQGGKINYLKVLS